MTTQPLYLAPKTTPEIAREALAILKRDGWNRGYLSLTEYSRVKVFALGSHCIGGAANLALSGGTSFWWQITPAARDFYQHLADAIVAREPDSVNEIGHESSPMEFVVGWNNSRQREDVFAVLESMAA